MMPLAGTSRQWPDCLDAWCNGEDGDADQHVHVTAQTNEVSHVCFPVTI